MDARMDPEHGLNFAPTAFRGFQGVSVLVLYIPSFVFLFLLLKVYNNRSFDRVHSLDESSIGLYYYPLTLPLSLTNQRHD